MRLSINLATRPYYNRRRVTALLVAGSLLLAMLFVLGLFRLTDNMRELQHLSREIAQLDARNTANRTAPGAQSTNLLQQRAAVLNTLAARQATHPWLQLLNDLESLVPVGTSLTKLEPGSKGELALVGRTRTLGELQRLMENLDKSARFRDTTLVSHNNLHDPELGNLVQFTIKSRIVTP